MSEEINAPEGGQIEEGTVSAETLKPGGGSAAGISKAEMLSTFTTLMSQLGKEDMTAFFKQVQDQYGPNKALNGKDNAASNRGSLAPMSRPVKEDVEEIFAGEELSEEFKEKAEVIFEAVLNTRWNLQLAELNDQFEAKTTELEESYATKLQEEVNGVFDDISEQLNQYLDYTVAEWMNENKVAIDNGLRGQIAEGFISGLQNLFAEHYITVPEEELDIMAEMRDQIAKLESTLDETVNENIELKATVSESVRAATIELATEGMTLVDAEKLKELAEGVTFADQATFERKLTIIKENYFKKAPAASTGLLKEETIEPAKPTVTPSVSAYADAISKQIAKK